MIYISKLWKFIQGYVIISIKGYNIEKLINKAIALDISVSGIKKQGNCAVVTVSPNEFKAFRRLSRKYKCKVKIINKNGLFRLFLFIRYNLFYLIGLILFVILVYVLTQRVWIIDITGNSQLSKYSILAGCSNDGLYVGCNKNKIDGKKIAENLKLTYKNISWVNISLKGTSVHIRLSEGKEEVVSTNSNLPCNITSAYDCQIASIVTNKGTPQVKKNDIVKAGDVLISAQLAPSGLEENPVTDIVSAKGTIRGIVTRNYAFTIPFNTKSKEYTDKSKTQYILKLFSKYYVLNKVDPFAQNEKSTEIIQLNLGENCPLPIILIKNINKEYISVPKKIDLETAKKQADTQIINHIAESYSVDSDILSVSTKYNETDNCLQINTEIISEENIGRETPFENIGGNSLNGTTENSNIS